MGVPVRRVGGRSFAELFPQLFIVPLLLVTVGVLVYLFFIASAQDNRSIEQIIQDMQSGGEHSRHQDAYALAQKVQELQNPTSGDEDKDVFWDSLVSGKPRREAPFYFTAEQTQRLIGLLNRFPDDAELNKWLVLAIGRAGQPEQTLPVLVAILSRDTTPAVRVTAIQALGLSRSKSALPLLEKQLERFQGSADEQWFQRLSVLQAMTHIGDPSVVGKLRRYVGDPQREVSWNTAYWLAYYFRDDGGVDVLRRLLDWEFIDRQKGERGRDMLDDAKQLYMRMALIGLYSVEGEGALDEVQSVADEARKRSYNKVLRTALDILAAHERAGAEGGGQDGAVGRRVEDGTRFVDHGRRQDHPQRKYETAAASRRVVVGGLHE